MITVPFALGRMQITPTQHYLPLVTADLNANDRQV